MTQNSRLREGSNPRRGIRDPNTLPTELFRPRSAALETDVIPLGRRGGSRDYSAVWGTDSRYLIIPVHCDRLAGRTLITSLPCLVPTAMTAWCAQTVACTMTEVEGK